MWISKSDFERIVSVASSFDALEKRYDNLVKLYNGLMDRVDCIASEPKVKIREPIILGYTSIKRESVEIPVLDILEMLAKEIGCKIEYVPGKEPGAQIVKQQKPKGAKK